MGKNSDPSKQPDKLRKKSSDYDVFVYLILGRFLELWVHIQVIIRSLVLLWLGHKGILLRTRGQKRTNRLAHNCFAGIKCLQPPGYTCYDYRLQLPGISTQMAWHPAAS